MRIVKIVKRGKTNTRVLLEDGSSTLVPNDTLKLVPVSAIHAASPVINPLLSVQDRFSSMEKLVALVVAGHSPSLLICGDAGIGKTYSVRKQLAKSGLTEVAIAADEPVEVDKKKKKDKVKPKVIKATKAEFLFVKGYSSPMGLYQVLHNNREALIVFDDCDAVFKAEVSINLLKSALDSYDRRIVSWFSPKCLELGLEQQFEFRGRVIFISNIPENRLNEAVKSRAFTLSLSLTKPELWARMLSLIDSIEPKVPIEIKTEVINYLGMNIDHFANFDLRTLIKAIRIRMSGEADWQKMILSFA